MLTCKSGHASIAIRNMQMNIFIRLMRVCVHIKVSKSHFPRIDLITNFFFYLTSLLYIYRIYKILKMEYVEMS